MKRHRRTHGLVGSCAIVAGAVVVGVVWVAFYAVLPFVARP